jgi:hypothetical protein
MGQARERFPKGRSPESGNYANEELAKRLKRHGLKETKGIRDEQAGARDFFRNLFPGLF